LQSISLYLLGTPYIERDGKNIEFDTRKATALLAYLAVAGTYHTRDALAALLWPDSPQTNARAALRRTLSTLNSALGKNFIESQGDKLGISPQANWEFDIHRFYEARARCGTHGHPVSQVCTECVPALEEAVRLYRDDFMAGFSLRDSSTFDDWQFFQSETLRQDFADTLEKLVRGYSDLGEYEKAIPCARRWLALDSLREDAHRWLMLLYAWNGQRNAALRQYQECVRILDQELGVEPLDETRALYEEIKENRLQPRQPRQFNVEIPVRRPVSQAASTRPYPLVGRTDEWTVLEQAYDSSARGEGNWVVLEGEAGIGKTRLAEEFLAQARSGGSVTLTARFYQGEGNLAYGAYVEILREALASKSQPDWLDRVEDEWLSEAARLAPEIESLRPHLPQPPPLETPGAQARFFTGISQVLAAVCAQPAANGNSSPPGVLFFDDLQWADESSQDLLTFMVRRLHDQHLLILGTWRGEDLPSDHRLRRLMAEARRTGNGALLTLSRLSLEAVKTLIRSMQPELAAEAHELGQRLYEETEGSAFCVVEYLTSLGQNIEGVRGGINAEEWPMPASVRDLLHSRLSEVSEAGLQLLQTGAVIGRSFPFEILKEASGRSEDETVLAVEELVGRGLLRELQSSPDARRGPVYDFSHDKMRSLVYSDTSLARRRLLHRRVAEALAAWGRTRQDLPSLAGRIAQHYKSAGQASEAAAYYRMAGEHARSLYANAEAIGHFEAALALGHPDRTELNEALGELHTLRGAYAAALERFEAAAALVSEPGERLGEIEHKIGDVYYRMGEWAQAENHFQSALDMLGSSGSQAECARIFADWSRTAHRQGQADRAQDLATQALKLAETAGDARSLAQAHNILGVLARSRADLEAAARHLQESLALAEKMTDPSARIAARNNLALVRAGQGDLPRAIELTQSALDLCVRIGDRHLEAALRNNLADLYHADGQAEKAMALLKEAVVIFTEIGDESGSARPEIWKLAEW